MTQVEEIFEDKAHEEQAFRALMGLQRLGKQYGPLRLEAACRRANAFGIVGQSRIRSILEHSMDTDPLPTELPTPTPIEHDNLRGAAYYH